MSSSSLSRQCSFCYLSCQVHPKSGSQNGDVPSILPSSPIPRRSPHHGTFHASQPSRIHDASIEEPRKHAISAAEAPDLLAGLPEAFFFLRAQGCCTSWLRSIRQSTNNTKGWVLSRTNTAVFRLPWVVLNNVYMADNHADLICPITPIAAPGSLGSSSR